MEKKRKVYAPFSLTSEAGVEQTPVEGYIDVNQTIYPIVNTGVVNENGKWTGVKSDDIEFKGLTKELKVTRAGSYGLTVVFGPSNSESTYLNLSPFAAGENITVNDGISVGFGNALADGGETLTADAWHIFTILERAKGQVNMQLKITNGSGGDSDIEFAYRRLV
jgi:hypothetical protein